VYYQPYVDMTTKRVGGAEALIKWKSDKHGLVSPAKFIPLLEDSGMIVDVGEWVLRTACRQIKEWDRGKSMFPVAVNLSSLQFRNKYLVEMVENTIKEAGVDPGSLTLEVTEGIFMHDLDYTSEVLERLKGLGVSISVDDFGTGYSSLSYLKRLPVDNVKIDMSFVKDITTDPDAASLVMAITSLARSLNLKTIAEGVETEEQWKILRLLRCDMGQGFYFSPALSPKEFEKLLT
jgi:EAL domain-containing protein (putative c-di-GMP-specific phosphodiesterase class I)